MRRVVTVGEMLIDFTAFEDNTSVMQASAFKRHPGGAPANVAVAVSRLGQPAAFAGCVGDDPFGRYLIETLEAFGVEADQTFQVPGVHTSLAFVARKDGDPDYFFVRNPGADVLFGPDLARQVSLTPETILHFGSNSLAEQPIEQAVTELVSRAQACGAIVSFDVNLRPAFWRLQEDEILDRCRKMATQADLLKVNRDELRWLSGCASVAEGLRELRTWSSAILLCTLGSEGAALGLDGSELPLRVAGFHAACVDATGAGDACIGALIAQLLARGVTKHDLSLITVDDWMKMTRFACAAASVNVTRTGAMFAMPVRAEVDAVLAASQQ